MRFLIVRGALVFSLFLVANNAALKGQGNACVLSQIDKPMIGMTTETGTIVELLTMVGRQSGVCFAIDVRDTSAFSQRIALSEGQNTLRKILALLPKESAYSIDHTVVSVRVGASRRRDWLDLIIPVFQTDEARIELASARVFDYLLAQTHPNGGTAGSAPSSFDAPLVKSFVEKGDTAGLILNRILAQSNRGGVWFTVGPHAARGPLPPAPFWTFLIYSDPPELNRLRIKQAVERYMN